ncbi:unnamed protein product [Natator depressus]
MGRLPAPSIICFFFFLVPLIAAGLRLQQLPPTASVLAGGSVTLSCTFHSRNQTGTQVTWARGSREAIVLDPDHPFYQGRLAKSQRDQQGLAEATVTLSELMERDSDLYHCYITHLQGKQAKGTGTTLTVMDRDDRKESKRDTSTELTIYRATIALAGVSIILLVTTLLLRGRKDTQRQQSAKGDSRAGGNTSEDLHYAEITFKAPAHTEYASIRTQQL